MDIRLKTDEEIEILAEGGKILAEILDELEVLIKPGATGKQLDETVQMRMKERDVKPAFLRYGKPPFPGAVCVSANEQVVHGLPDEYTFCEGDVIGIDVGLAYKGMYVDSARTIGVACISDDARRLLAVTKDSLMRGIAAAAVGNTIGHIGEAIQTCVENAGFEVVRTLVGHGVGYAVHEDPRVPNFGAAGKGTVLKHGLVIAIEPMVTVGNADITTASDKWTVVTASGGLAAHEEHTIAVTHDGPRILTL